MALSANFLGKLPEQLARSIQLGGFQKDASCPSAGHLPTGVSAIDQELPDQGLLRGSLVELAVQGGASLATSLGLCVCRSAQEAAENLGGVIPWCAFIDVSRSLYAPGVAKLGVRLDRLLIVRPSLEALVRVALRITESQCFAVVVIDMVGTPGAELQVALGAWPRVVRRLALAIQETQSTVLLITEGSARRPLPLPVAQRIELSRPQAHKLILQVAKDKRGRVSAPRSISLFPAVSRAIPSSFQAGRSPKAACSTGQVSYHAG